MLYRFLFTSKLASLRPMPGPAVSVLLSWCEWLYGRPRSPKGGVVPVEGYAKWGTSVYLDYLFVV